jgi:hypothetical protein
VTQKDGVIIKYNLNTLPANSKVLKGLSVGIFADGYKLNAEQYDELVGMINTVADFV